VTKILIKITIKGAYAMINDEKYIRENIEKCIDDYHKSHELFNESLPTVVLNLLRVFEDSCSVHLVKTYVQRRAVKESIDINSNQPVCNAFMSNKLTNSGKSLVIKAFCIIMEMSKKKENNMLFIKCI
jgi:hypothetical protein